MVSEKRCCFCFNAAMESLNKMQLTGDRTSTLNRRLGNYSKNKVPPPPKKNHDQHSLKLTHDQFFVTPSAKRNGNIGLICKFILKC